MSRNVPEAQPWGVIGEQDLYLFGEGTHIGAYRALGAHPGERDGEAGTRFAVWAPNAEWVAVVGEFNGWDGTRDLLFPEAGSGIWAGFVRGVGRGTVYKYRIMPKGGRLAFDKADPFGFHHQVPPLTSSIVWDLDYAWGDGEWMAQRAKRNALTAPVSIYEVHLGSWMRVPEDGNRSLGYREVAPRLADYVLRMGFTHVELLPIMEHPFFGSWGYQCTGFFAPTSRFGTPQDFMWLVDHLHQRGIGVILDWVPSHFPEDAYALGDFDGTALFEHADPKQGFHPDWKSSIFNYGRHEVASFLKSSAHFWLKVFHADGLRVDAVASMLYLDYSRKAGEWVPNVHGGRENLEAIAFLRDLNESIYREHPDAQTIAEESTSWPMVSRPLYIGGLGFGMKWDMGWMHDTLKYFQEDPVYRKYHHRDVTFRMMYAFFENFVLPLSHDEVVHGKGSLLGKMPGDEWQKFANLRLMLGYMWAQAGKKLLFMGCEFGQRREWNHDGSLDWHLAEQDQHHRGVQSFVAQLNDLYRTVPALHQYDFDPAGFRWIDANDADDSVISFLRCGRDPSSAVAVLCNFTPIPRPNYRIGVPFGGFWKERLNSDAAELGGGGWGNLGGVEAAPIPSHGHRFALHVTIPPLGIVFLEGREEKPPV
jgi:1,4-alpha-glucan branching enzyme